MGDTIDNIKGVPGIGEKGARELIAHVRHRSRTCSRTPPRCKNKRYREGLLGQRRRRAPEPRAGADPHRRAGRVRRRGAALSRRLARALLRRSSTSSASARSSTEYAPTADTIAKTYRVVNTADGAARARRPAAGRRPRSRCASAGPAVGDARGDRRPGVLDGAARRATTCRSATARSATATSTCRSTAALDSAAADSRGRGDREGRPRPEVRRDRARAPRRRRCAASTSTRCSRATCSTPTRSEHRLEDLALEHTSYKALTEEDVCGRGAKAVSLARRAGRSGGRLRRRARRPRRPARADASRPAREGAARRASTRRSSCR